MYNKKCNIKISPSFLTLSAFYRLVCYTVLKKPCALQFSPIKQRQMFTLASFSILLLWILYMRKYVQCREQKTGQHKVQFYCEDEIHRQSGYSLSMVWGFSSLFWLNQIRCRFLSPFRLGLVAFPRCKFWAANQHAGQPHWHRTS